MKYKVDNISRLKKWKLYDSCSMGFVCGKHNPAEEVMIYTFKRRWGKLELVHYFHRSPEYFHSAEVYSYDRNGENPHFLGFGNFSIAMKIIKNYLAPKNRLHTY